MKFNFDKHSLVRAEEILQQVAQLKDYEKLLNNVFASKKYNFPESFVKLPFDEANVARILKLREKVMSPNIKYIVVVGIGGSNLGAKAVYDAMHGYADVVEPNRFPKMIFVETLQPQFTKKVTRLLQNEQALLILISKNGSTSESLSNFQILLNTAPKAKNNVVVITNELSKLLEKAKKQGYNTLSMPQLIGGRYSVFTSVGLFPLACANIDIINFCEGGMKAMSDIEGAEISSSIIHAHYRNGKDVFVSFLFDSRLETFGKWQRQLTSESLGKRDYCGNPQGLTPEISIGTTDMHSMLQLYLSGKTNRQFNFIKSTAKGGNAISSKHNTTDAQLLNEIYHKTKTVFVQKQVPFIETELQGVNETELGYLMQFKMLETAFLARFLNVNAFDQPNVDEFKKI